MEDVADVPPGIEFIHDQFQAEYQSASCKRQLTYLLHKLLCTVIRSGGDIVSQAAQNVGG